MEGVEELGRKVFFGVGGEDEERKGNDIGEEWLR
jgi:hypothetical protein